MDKVFISIDRDGWSNALQLSVDLEREDGTGHGYRITGPKFNGSSKKVFRHQVSERDAKEIQSYIDAVIPIQSDGGGESRPAPASGSGPLHLAHCQGDACSAVEPTGATYGRQQELKHADGVTPVPSDPHKQGAAALKPCPFCGSTDIFAERYDFSSSYMFCNNCCARGPAKTQDNDDEENPGEEDSKRAWNTRPVSLDREAVARIVYDAFPFEQRHGMAEKPAWVPNGNSLRQDDARNAADAIIALIEGKT